MRKRKSTTKACTLSLRTGLRGEGTTINKAKREKVSLLFFNARVRKKTLFILL